MVNKELKKYLDIDLGNQIKIEELQTQFKQLRKDINFLQGFMGFLAFILILLGIIKLFG